MNIGILVKEFWGVLRRLAFVENDKAVIDVAITVYMSKRFLIVRRTLTNEKSESVQH